MAIIFRIVLLCCFVQLLPTTEAVAHISNKKNSDTLTNKYLFVEWKHQDSIIMLGVFSSDGKKRQTQFSCKINSLKKEDIDKWLGENNTGAILLFHCMWGQQAGFHRKKYLQSVDKILAPQPLLGIHTEISFIWHAGGVLYKKNWNAAAGKGEPLGQLLQWVAAHYNYNIHALCHSMGNRFFEGIVRTMPSSVKAFKSITLFSADLVNSSTDLDFINCKNATSSLYIYIHHKDRFLLLSSWLHGIKRLGRNGPLPDTNSATIVDMTMHEKGLQNHTHLDKKWVQQQLSAQLIDKN